MYVEISPRQTGKTQRLVEKASDYLYESFINDDVLKKIKIVSPIVAQSKEIKERIKIRLCNKIALDKGLQTYSDAIKVYVSTFFNNNIIVSNKTGYINEINVDYYFFDEFDYIDVEDLLDPVTHNIIENGYYTTTPKFNTNFSLDMIKTHCDEYDININYYMDLESITKAKQVSFNMFEHLYKDYFDFLIKNNYYYSLESLIHKPFIKKHKFL
jgi:hypothetical protein